MVFSNVNKVESFLGYLLKFKIYLSLLLLIPVTVFFSAVYKIKLRVRYIGF